MIEQIQQFFSNPAKVTRLALYGFFATVLVTAYWLFTLPHDLVYDGGMIDSGRAASVYAKLFTVIGLAFALCYVALLYTQRIKKETIVYLDKKLDNASAAGQQNANADHHDSLDTAALREKISKQKSKEDKWQQGLNLLCSQLGTGQGALYSLRKSGDKKVLELKAGFALVLAEGEENPVFDLGEGLIGQVAAAGKSLYLDELPEGYAARIESGLGSALPKFLFIFPMKKENEVVGVVEIATFMALSEDGRKQAQQAGNVLAEIS